MNPNKETGNVTLEGGKDRRYARAAARRIGNAALLETIDEGQKQAWNKLRDDKAATATPDQITLARIKSIVVPSMTVVKQDEDVAKEIGTSHAHMNIGKAPSELNAEHVPALESGLAEIAGGSAVRAALSLTRRKTAAEMLQDIQAPPAGPDTYIEHPVNTQPH